MRKWQWHFSVLIIMGLLIVVGEYLAGTCGGAIGIGLGAVILNHFTIMHARWQMQERHRRGAID